MHQGSDANVNRDAKGVTNRGIHAPSEILKIRNSRLAKNACAIQHLLHYSIVYTSTLLHY